MKIFLKKTTFLTFLLVGTLSANSQIKLPEIIASNMVLQRNSEVALWGWALPNKKITIRFSWLKKHQTITTDAQGNWQTRVVTSEIKTPQTITITQGKEKEILSNVLFGEVWLCSGQSNMFQPLTGYTGQPTFGGLKAISTSTNENLRLFSVERNVSKTPQKDVKASKKWTIAHPTTVADFSSVSYFFGQQLQEILDVPVGLIHTSWGGSKIEAWMSKESLGAFKKVDLSNVDMKKGRPHIPTALYNSMIAPIIPYTIKGALWYQGESNRDNPDEYAQLFPAMVKDWRSKWSLGEFPFYYVQIAPYHYKAKEAFSSFDNTAYLREAQFKSLQSIPNTGMAVTLDIGDERKIHPPQKQEVADRLLYIALNNTYGYKDIDFSGPLYDTFEIKDSSIYLKFKYTDEGYYAPKKLEGFEIAGEDKVFYPADAKVIHYTQILVKSKYVANPVAVRYGWSNWVQGTLFDTNLLPASSFRTDDWDNAIRSKKE